MSYVPLRQNTEIAISDYKEEIVRQALTKFSTTGRNKVGTYDVML
jgi:hypothetical protein